MRCSAWGGRVLIRRSRKRLTDGVNDLLVTGAPTEVSRDAVTNLFVAEVDPRIDDRLQCHQKTGRAEPALQSMTFIERALQRVELTVLGETFDSPQAVPIGLNCEHHAGAHRFTIEKHCARAAHAVFAADMRAGQSQLVADEV